jgi:hypothetical protein
MEPTIIQYPTHVAAEFLNREEQEHLTIEQAPGGPKFNALFPDHRGNPTHAILKQLVETMLFASMATEEGQLTPVGIVFAESLARFQAPQPGWDLVLLASREPFEVSQLAKLATACGSLESLLVVLTDENKLVVAGIATPHTRKFAEFDGLVRVRILKPGVISIGRHGGEAVRYERGKIRPKPPELVGGDGQYRIQLDSIEKTVFQEEPTRLQIDVA